jgi:hypothetical protein
MALGLPPTDEATAVRPLPPEPIADVPTDADTLVRGRSEPTRPIPIEEALAAQDSQPVAIAPRPRDAETRPIELRENGPAPSRSRRAASAEARTDLDALAAEWGVSEDRLMRVLKRARPRMAEATAELERLLLKPPRAPAPSKAEAMAGLAALLERRAATAAPAGGDADGSDPSAAPHPGNGSRRR